MELIIIETTIHDPTQTDHNIRLILILTQTLGLDTIQTIDQEIHLSVDTGNIPTTVIEATQIVEISDIKTIDREIIQTEDQNIKDLTTIFIKIDHEIIHKIETQTITIDKETILNHLIEIKHATLILKTNKEVNHQNIKTNKSSTNN